ncbi:LysR family transcriptional regulator [Bradyrhizobium liaoningense]|uniref:LysR family transcriptional regulator n=1 Tax=Bradyrhizobium liaoningense TaxID=43992 RepID=UPI001BA55306|nr:LysR family transcriptional regulator [Bradyrhizobium liaoningense]MBR0822696.1 LysR family transcriptional regulator [Bradyrhizobium liaoningense]
MNIELRHLRYFVAVAEDLHFGKAANRLGISQPPLSQQILALEREIGARLFERSNRRVELTNAGMLFLKEAHEVLERVENAAVRAERIHRGQLGEVKIGFFGSAPFVEGFQKLIFDFRTKHADVDLVLQEMPTYQQVDAILDGRLDLGFVRPLQPKPASIQSIEIARERLMAVMRLDHPLASRQDDLTLADLAPEPMVLYAKSIGSGLYQKIVDLCRDAGFTPNVVQEANATPTMMGLVAAGMGISVLPESLMRLSLDGLKFLPLRDPKAQTAVWLAKRWDDRSSLVRHLFQQASRLKPKTSAPASGGEPTEAIGKVRRTRRPR